MSLDATTEFERLNALRRYAILDTPPEGVFDRITALAADMLDVPVAVVSLVDTDRVWYKSVHGPLPEREMRRLPGLCGAAVAHDGPYVVESAGSRSADPGASAGARGRSASSSTSACRCAPTTATRSACSPAWTPGRAASTRASCGSSRRSRRSSWTRSSSGGRRAQISRLSEALAETCDDLERRASFDPLTGVLARSALLARGAGAARAAAAAARARRC